MLNFRLIPEQRNCYSDDEISLKFLPKTAGYRYIDIIIYIWVMENKIRYEMSNCLFEATFEKILENCKVRY